MLDVDALLFCQKRIGERLVGLNYVLDHFSAFLCPEQTEPSVKALSFV